MRTHLTALPPRQDRARRYALLFRAAFEDIVATASPHGLESGAIVREKYTDLDIAVRDPIQALEWAEVYAAIITEIRTRRAVDGLAFLKKDDVTSSNTIGALLLAALISTHPSLLLPYLVVRLDKDIPHERLKFPDAADLSTILSGLTFLVVTDHITGGGEIVATVQALEDYGARVNDVVTATVRRDILAASLHTQAFLNDRHIEVSSLAETEAQSDEHGNVALVRFQNERVLQRLTAN
jgi:orotate phosphoribosyltransferase